MKRALSETKTSQVSLGVEVDITASRIVPENGRLGASEIFRKCSDRRKPYVDLRYCRQADLGWALHAFDDGGVFFADLVKILSSGGGT